MQNNDRKKTIALLIVLILLIIVCTYLNRQKAADEAAQEEPAVTTETEETAGAKTEAPVEEPAEGEDDIVVIDGVEYSRKEAEEAIAALEELETKETFIDLQEDVPENTEQQVEVGAMDITLNSADARYGSGEVAGQKTELIWYHDGNSEDIKGTLMAMDAFGDDPIRPETQGDLEYLTSEYVPDGAGVSSEWEECTDFFVRKVMGYDSEADGAYLSYTIVPKTTVDNHMYNSIFTINGGEIKPTAIKESSFNSMNDGLKALVPDCSFFQKSYKEIESELMRVNFYQTATEAGFSGLTDLRESENQYYLNTYGVALDGSTEKRVSDLTAEEIDDAEWRAEDPIGYAQEKREQGVADAIKARYMEEAEDEEELTDAGAENGAPVPEGMPEPEEVEEEAEQEAEQETEQEESTTSEE